MPTKKIILKTARARKGTVSRAAIRKAVQNVFGGTKVTKATLATKATERKKAGTGILQAH
jgi:RNase P/RNase MRP subunit POP5